MVGFTRCNDCKKWKAHKAFVRSRVRRDTELWIRNGYMWHKYKSCNRCFRTYRNKGMSVDEFIKVFGAEEHDLSEPEILIDEEAQGIQDKPAPKNDAMDGGAEVEGDGDGDDAKLSGKHSKTQDDKAEHAAVKKFKLERLVDWLADQEIQYALKYL